MKRLTLVVILALTFIGMSLTVSLMATDGSLAQAHERKRFRADLQTTTRLVEPPPGRCIDQPGLPPVVGLLEVVGAGDATFLGPVVDEQSHCVRADGSFFGGVFKLTNAEGDTIRGRYFGHLEPTSIPHFHHRLQAAPGSSMVTSASAAVAPAISTTTVRLITTSRREVLPTCPPGMPRFSSTRQSGSIEHNKRAIAAEAAARKECAASAKTPW